MWGVRFPVSPASVLKIPHDQAQSGGGPGVRVPDVPEALRESTQPERAHVHGSPADPGRRPEGRSPAAVRRPARRPAHHHADRRAGPAGRGQMTAEGHRGCEAASGPARRLAPPTYNSKGQTWTRASFIHDFRIQTSSQIWSVETVSDQLPETAEESWTFEETEEEAGKTSDWRLHFMFLCLKTDTTAPRQHPESRPFGQIYSELGSEQKGSEVFV